MKKKLNCVLLVDDDNGTNFINQMIIKKADIAEYVQTVLNGKEALDFITNKGKFEKAGDVFPQPMLTLLDINMPVMDGWEFLEAYHALEERQKGKIIIIMLTTSLNPDDKSRADDISEVSDYKSKPLSLEIVDDIMKTHFSDYL
ncbi:response regulator [Flavobacterium sufflavum]|uniref:Response regulator n=1 Tax=Flavobacterium sufflavum TaxID=1921138 RepID=A0A437L413_9FLAO|nr:response regulator [Flavobacterium sufflavum]RVT80041.1 response regulator [Flavobacterium sufflavum]